MLVLGKKGELPELEGLVANLESLAGPGIIVFRCTDLPEDQVVLWDGCDFSEFLEVFHKFDGKVLYLRQDPIQVEDEAPGHVGELSRVDIGFLDHGYFHVFRKNADWLMEALAGQEMSLESPPLSIKDMRNPERTEKHVRELNEMIEEMLGEIPAKKWTAAMVTDWCLENGVPKHLCGLLYGRIKRRLAKGAGIEENREEDEIRSTSNHTEERRIE